MLADQEGYQLLHVLHRKMLRVKFSIVLERLKERLSDCSRYSSIFGTKYVVRNLSI